VNLDNRIIFHDAVFMALILTTKKTTNSVCRLQKEPATVDKGAMVASLDKTHPWCAVARNRANADTLFVCFFVSLFVCSLLRTAVPFQA
jgi:hypothetical protein